jgi:sulfite oxidase
VGARSVKWLHKIVLSDRESSSHWQRNDYKLLSPIVRSLNEADFSKVKAIQESPVQSAICEPQEGTVLEKEDGTFTIKGYAYSGGGDSIESVMVTLDNGVTWKTAVLKKIEQPLYRYTLKKLEKIMPSSF